MISRFRFLLRFRYVNLPPVSNIGCKVRLKELFTKCEPSPFWWHQRVLLTNLQWVVSGTSFRHLKIHKVVCILVKGDTFHLNVVPSISHTALHRFSQGFYSQHFTGFSRDFTGSTSKVFHFVNFASQWNWPELELN